MGMENVDAFKWTKALPVDVNPLLESISEMVIPLATIAFLFYPVALHLYVVYTGRSGRKSPTDDADAAKSILAQSILGTSQPQFCRQSSRCAEPNCSNANCMWATAWDTLWTGSCIPRRRSRSGSEEDFANLVKAKGSDPANAEGWWGPADSRSAHGLENARPLSTLLEMRIIRHGTLSGTRVLPWHADKSMDIYRNMGMRKSTSSYVVSWLNLGKSSFLFVSEVLDEQRLQLCIGRDALMNRLKLILRPVHASLPFPAKAAPEADTIGAFFGVGEGSSCVQHVSGDGIRYACVQVALYSKWHLRLAMQTFGFREGNVIEMLIVDWPGQAILAASRITVTPDLLRLLE